MDRVIARTVRVHGHVQGVFFRASCREQAEAHGVTGWARNEPDGTVSVWIEGEPRAVEAMVEWCREGPPAARISDVEVEDVEPRGTQGFSTG